MIGAHTPPRGLVICAALAAVVGCARDRSNEGDAVASPTDRAPAMAEGSAGAAPSVDSSAPADGSSAPTPAHDFARQVQTVPGTRAGQVVLADLMLDALERESPADVSAALRVLGRRLAEYRSQGYQAVLVRALQRFAAAESAGMRRRVDGRFAIPAVEVFLDVRDRAALERLAVSYDGGPAETATASARDLARTFPGADVPLEIGDIPESCTLFIDGRAHPDDRASVAVGSHTVACGSQGRALVEVRPPGARLVYVDGELELQRPVP